MKLTRQLAVLAVGTTLVALSGCGQREIGLPLVNQADACQMSGLVDEPGNCKPGQKVVFLPQQFGNEQLPVMFAALNCDLRFSVALTKGAVACIYLPIDRKPEDAPAPAKP